MRRWSSGVPKDTVTQVSEQLLYVDVESFSTSEGTLLKQRDDNHQGLKNSGTYKWEFARMSQQSQESEHLSS